MFSATCITAMWFLIPLLMIKNAECKNFTFAKKLENYDYFKPGDQFKCKTNDPAIITWQKCSFGGYVFGCGDLLKDPHHSHCENILLNDTLFKIDDFKESSTSILTLRKPPELPEEACVRCIAKQESANLTIIQTSPLEIAEKCGTPLKKFGIGSHQWYPCRRTDFIFPRDAKSIKKFREHCEVSSVRNIRTEQRLDSSGKVDVTVFWQEPEYRKSAKTYGYEIKLQTVENYYNYDEKWCLITRYNIKKDGLYHSNLKGRFFEMRPNTQYIVNITAFPISTPAEHKFKIATMEELCDAYMKKHGKRIHACHIVTNIKVGKCTVDKSVTISWNRSKDSDQYTYTTVHKSPYNMQKFLPKDQTTWTITNVTRTVFAHIRINTSYEIKIDIPPCKDIPTTVLPTTQPIAEAVTTNSKINIFIPMVIVLIVVFTVSLFVLFLYCGLKKARKGIKHEMERLRSVDSGEYSFEEQGETVMLVYPHGCREVENIVLFLAGQLRSFGIKVLVDNLQPARVANLGLPSVLVQDFKDADYVVTICTEKETTKLPSHRPYTFVLNQLISSDCVYQNGDRYIAVYFSKSTNMVPLYLRHRSYYLPSALQNFIQNLLGIETYFSSVYGKFFNAQVNHYKYNRKELESLVEALNKVDHNFCNSESCSKGKVMESINMDYPTNELLQKEVEKYKVLNQDNCSLRFSSAESLADQEKEDSKLLQQENTNEHFKESDEHCVRT